MQDHKYSLNNTFSLLLHGLLALRIVVRGLVFRRGWICICPHASLIGQFALAQLKDSLLYSKAVPECVFELHRVCNAFEIPLGPQQKTPTLLLQDTHTIIFHYCNHYNGPHKYIISSCIDHTHIWLALPISWKRRLHFGRPIRSLELKKR